MDNKTFEASKASELFRRASEWLAEREGEDFEFRMAVLFPGKGEENSELIVFYENKGYDYVAASKSTINPTCGIEGCAVISHNEVFKSHHEIDCQSLSSNGACDCKFNLRNDK